MQKYSGNLFISRECLVNSYTACLIPALWNACLRLSSDQLFSLVFPFIFFPLNKILRLLQQSTVCLKQLVMRHACPCGMLRGARGELWVLPPWQAWGFGCSRGDSAAALRASSCQALRVVQTPPLPSRAGSARCLCPAEAAAGAAARPEERWRWVLWRR